MIVSTVPARATEIIRRFQSPIPVDVLKVAEAFGLKVYESDKHLPVGASGMILRNAKAGGESGYCIIVRSSEPLVRKRFTVAHEIGHFILHRDKIGNSLSDDALYRSGLSTLEEAEANRLAADILMPREAIRAYASELGITDPAVLSRAFLVSEMAMRIRLGMT